MEKLENTIFFKPRYVELTSFIPINDEEIDKMDEWEVDETILLRDYEAEIKEFKGDVSEVIPIIAVDASSCRIGETENGVLAAYRAAMVIHSDESKVEKVGPYILHITEENKLGIYNYFRRLLGLSSVNERRVPRISKLVDRIRNAIERIMQKIAASTIKDGIVLWDGSLTGGTVDTPKEVIERNIKTAFYSGNSVIGISKRSWLRTISGKRLINLLEDYYKACYIDIHNYIASRDLSRYLGRILVVKFSPYGFTFRVDVAPKPGLEPSHVLELLFTNCEMYNGYPNPLRQAHMESYLTANEVLALQAYIIQKYNLKVLKPLDIRKFILGPYG